MSVKPPEVNASSRQQHHEKPSAGVAAASAEKLASAGGAALAAAVPTFDSDTDDSDHPRKKPRNPVEEVVHVDGG